jgi:hypothetical protein
MLGNNPELVESYDDLRPGMIVMVIGCPKGKHTGMLLGPAKFVMVSESTGAEWEDEAFDLVPSPVEHQQLGVGVTRLDVAARMVYRMPDGLDENSKQFTAPISKSNELVNVLVKR